MPAHIHSVIIDLEDDDDPRFDVTVYSAEDSSVGKAYASFGVGEVGSSITVFVNSLEQARQLREAAEQLEQKFRDVTSGRPLIACTVCGRGFDPGNPGHHEVLTGHRADTVARRFPGAPK